MSGRPIQGSCGRGRERWFFTVNCGSHRMTSKGTEYLSPLATRLAVQALTFPFAEHD